DQGSGGQDCSGGGGSYLLLAQTPTGPAHEEMDDAGTGEVGEGARGGRSQDGQVPSGEGEHGHDRGSDHQQEERPPVGVHLLVDPAVDGLEDPEPDPGARRHHDSAHLDSCVAWGTPCSSTERERYYKRLRSPVSVARAKERDRLVDGGHRTVAE